MTDLRMFDPSRVRGIVEAQEDQIATLRAERNATFADLRRAKEVFAHEMVKKQAEVDRMKAVVDAAKVWAIEYTYPLLNDALNRLEEKP